MGDLLEKRIKFTKLLASLLGWFYQAMEWKGYSIVIGQDGLKHMKGSLHFMGLAADLLLYKDGKFLDKTEDYKEMGEKWESLDPECCWGGRFSKPDGDHFSIGYGGRK